MREASEATVRKVLSFIERHPNVPKAVDDAERDFNELVLELVRTTGPYSPHESAP